MTDADVLRPPAPSRDAAVRSAGWWGATLAVTVLGVILGVLVYSYVQLAVEAEEWPPAAIGGPERGPFALAALALVASAVAAWRTGRSFGAGRPQPVIASVLVTMVAGVAAAVILASALRDQPSVPGDHAYASMVAVLVWYSLVLIGVGLVMQLITAARVLHGPHDLRLQVVIDVARLFWWFVVASGLVVAGTIVFGAGIG